MLNERLEPRGTAVSGVREKTYTGSADVVRKTVRQRGVTGLYRGVQVLLTGTIPTYALRSEEEPWEHVTSGHNTFLSQVRNIRLPQGPGDWGPGCAQPGSEDGVRPRGGDDGGRAGGHLDRDPQGAAHRRPKETQAKIQGALPCCNHYRQKRGEC